jgi:hypothetical protein
MSRLSSRCAVLTAAALLFGCKGKEASPPPAVSESLLRVTTSDYAFEAPDQIPPGVTTVRLANTGPSLHHVQLIKLNDGKTANDFMEAAKTEGPPPPWAVLIGGPNAAVPGDSSTGIVSLEAGNYVMVCFIPGTDLLPHLAHGMVRPLTVTGTPVVNEEPVASDTVRLVDYSFALSHPLSAGRSVIRVENGGQQAHELVVVKLAPGKTVEDFVRWTDTMAGMPPGEPRGGVTSLMPGAHEYFVADLTPGEYGLFCFFPDMKDGKMHVVHGMVSSFTVS